MRENGRGRRSGRGGEHRDCPERGKTEKTEKALHKSAHLGVEAGLPWRIRGHSARFEWHVDAMKPAWRLGNGNYRLHVLRERFLQI